MSPPRVNHRSSSLELFDEPPNRRLGSTFLTFKAPDTMSWKPGDYKVEIRLGDEVGGSEGFEIEAAAG